MLAAEYAVERFWVNIDFHAVAFGRPSTASARETARIKRRCGRAKSTS